MKKLIIFLIAAIISECSGEPFNAIDLAIDEICIVKSTHTGLPRISEKDSIKLIDRPEIIERHIRKISENGKDYYQILNKTTLINNQTYENTSFIEIGETLKEISLDFVRKGPDGKEIEKKYVRFDDPSWQYPDDLYSIHVLPMVLRTMISQNTVETDFNLMLSTKSIIRMNVKLSGREKISVPSGEYSCVKIIMQPDIQSVVKVPKSVSFFIKPFVSDHEFWFSDKAPYPLVKYRGQPGMPGTPTQILEMVMYDNLQNKKIISRGLAKNEPAN